MYEATRVNFAASGIRRGCWSSGAFRLPHPPVGVARWQPPKPLQAWGPIHVGLGFSGAAEWAAKEGLTALKRGDNEVAVQMLQIAVQLKEDSAMAWHALGGALFKSGRFEEAAHAVRRFLELEAPTSPRVESARQFLSSLQSATSTLHTGDVEGWCNKAVVLAQSGRHEGALACFDSALEADPASLQAWNDRAISLAALGRHEEAVANYDKALEINPEASATWFNRGNSLADLGRPADAVASYRRFISLASPDLAHLVSQARKIVAELKSGEEARDVPAEPENVSTFDEEQAQRLLEAGKIEEGLKLAEDALKIDSRRPGPHGIKANALMFLGKDQEAFEILEKALSQWANHGQLRLRMGLVCNKLCRYEEARGHFQRLLQSGAGDLKNRVEVALADSLIYSKEYAEALKVYDGALADNPQFGPAWINRGLALYNLGRYKEALDSIDRGEAMWPNHPTVGMLRRAITNRLSI